MHAALGFISKKEEYNPEWNILKACVCYFHQIFIFSPDDSPYDYDSP